MSAKGASSPAANAAAAGRKRRIFVLDDEPGMQRLLRLILEEEGHEVFTTDSGAQALSEIERGGCDLIVQDLRMPLMDGLTFLRQLKERYPDILAIVVTAFGTWETAVEAMRLGAYTHLAKPFDTEEFRQLIARALERKELARASDSSHALPLLDIISSSQAMLSTIQMVKRIAPTDSTVLLTGESGTGKELIARAIHYNSLRAKGPFVPVNCGAFAETLLESELFGHVKGAFTHAIADRKGLFEAADRGTVFLDEVGEMSPPMQVKLLRVLETRTYRPVGGSRDIPADVRMIAATNRILAQMVADGNFREDLFHRLNVIPIVLPPLRERPEDVPLLAGHFLARYSKRMNKSVTSIEEPALRRLVDYAWPGNVRELENAIERAVALSTGDRIGEADIIGPVTPHTSSGRLASAVPPATAHGLAAPVGDARFAHGSQDTPKLAPAGMDLERHLLELERDYILQALNRSDWNLTEAAKLLGMTFRSIRYRISKLGIERPPR